MSLQWNQKPQVLLSSNFTDSVSKMVSVLSQTAFIFPSAWTFSLLLLLFCTLYETQVKKWMNEIE